MSVPAEGPFPSAPDAGYLHTGDQAELRVHFPDVFSKAAVPLALLCVHARRVARTNLTVSLCFMSVTVKSNGMIIAPLRPCGVPF
jgi:hypothetical protein